MMTRLILLFAAAIALTTVNAAAADVNGTWKAEFTTPDGTPRTNTFILKVDGAKLTGTVKGASDETPIANGTVSGDDISFSAERPFGKFTYKGKASGDEIKFQVEFNDQKFEFTAKRVAK